MSKRKPHILIVSAVFPPEPVVSASLSFDLATKLSNQYKVTVLCPKPSRPKGFDFSKGFNGKNNTTFEIKYLPSFTNPDSNLFGRIKESISFGKFCAEYIDKNKNEIDVVYANTWPMFSQNSILKATKKNSIPCILHIQDIYPESFVEKLPSILGSIIKRILLPFDRSILKKASHVICISYPMINYLSRTRCISTNKFTLVRNWQNDQSFIDFNRGITNKTSFIFMYAGSISPTAGIENLLYAFNDAKIDNSKLVIAGTGADKEKCQQIAKRLNNLSIEFTNVSPENVPELQSIADVLILPLKKNIAKTATPSKLTAYLLSAKPVIACVEKESDVANIIQNAECGFIVEPENIQMLSECMKIVEKLGKNELDMLGKRGREFSLRELSKESNLNKLIRLIELNINNNGN